MTLQEFSLLLVSILSSVAGQFLLKSGALKLGKVSTENAISHIFSILTVPELIAGLLCYGLGAIAYILLLTRVNLSIAGPSIALVYVFFGAVRLLHVSGNYPARTGNRTGPDRLWCASGGLAEVRL